MKLLTATVMFVSVVAQAAAQGLTIQQPVVSTFSTPTTVSVPDRGRVFLGGVSSAASSRTAFGPLWQGPSLGREVRGSSVSASVYIHDLQAMDEALLSMGAPSGASEDGGWYAAQLSSRHGAGRLRQPPAESPTDGARQAARFEKLARAAEARGKETLARLHWQMAAKYGSTAARQVLDDVPAASSLSATLR